ncbi:MAG: PIG-L family deacetylase [Actinomycetota bacterium]|nr:MAG: PIG-L family deacetylase [Actinomycetota bacterium]
MSTYLTSDSTNPLQNLEVPSSALAIGAHPDDIEFGCGGTLAKWAAKGCKIFHLVCTDGSKGTWDSNVDGAALATRRQQEQTEAARILGGTIPVTFLGWTDGELQSGMQQRAQIVRAIRRLKPEIVLAHDPWKRYRLHPDHRHAGFLATDGVVAARDPLFFPELGTHHRPSKMLLWEADDPDHEETIDEETFKVKLQALKAHASQYESTMGVNQLDDETQMIAFEERLRSRMTESALGQTGNLAEIFKLITKV